MVRVKRRYETQIGQSNCKATDLIAMRNAKETKGKELTLQNGVCELEVRYG